MKLKYVNKELGGTYFYSNNNYQILDLKENEIFYFNSFNEVTEFLKKHLTPRDNPCCEKYTFNYYEDAKITFSISDKNNQALEVLILYDDPQGWEAYIEVHPLGYLYLLKEEDKDV